MKVTFITREYPPYVYGGAGVHIRELARCLADMMEVEVRCFGDQNDDESGIRVKGYQVEPKPHCKFEPRFDSLFNTLYTNLKMLVDGIDGDVIHTHTWYAHFAGFMGKMLYNLPYVATSHSLEPLRPWKVDQLGRAYHVSAWMEKVGLENADRVVAVSRMMKQDIIDNFQVDPDKVVVIHNGIDLKKYCPTPISQELKDKYPIEDDYVLFVGRPTAQKGMEYLIDAADEIPCQIVIEAVGADTPEYEEKMMAKVREKNNILWIHESLGDRLNAQLYSGARVFICPSVYEPFGIINLEAMACETPVVASAVGGIKEVVIPEETGYLVEPGQADQIAQAVNRILADPELGRKMGQAGRKRVEDYFSWESIAAQTKNMYEGLVS